MPDTVILTPFSGDDSITIENRFDADSVVICPFRPSYGSGEFGQSVNSYLASPPSSDWAFGTGDFTWEWWQYQESSSLTGRSQFPRIFETSMYSSIECGVTIEGSPNTMYIWCGPSVNTSRTLTGHTGKWTHFAVTRTGSVLRIFQDGTQLGANGTSNENILNTKHLFIGRESGSTYQDVTQFPGKITNLHLVKGYCKYTGSFTVTLQPIERISGSTVLLLLMDSQGTFTQDSSGYNKTVVSGSTTVWTSNSPF